MAVVQVQCPDCQSTDVVQYGKQANGTQRCRGNNRDCSRTIFLLEYEKRPLESLTRKQEVEIDICSWSGHSSLTAIHLTFIRSC